MYQPANSDWKQYTRIWSGDGTICLPKYADLQWMIPCALKCSIVALHCCVLRVACKYELAFSHSRAAAATSRRSFHSFFAILSAYKFCSFYGYVLFWTMHNWKHFVWRRTCRLLYSPLYYIARSLFSFAFAFVLQRNSDVFGRPLYALS